MTQYHLTKPEDSAAIFASLEHALKSNPHYLFAYALVLSKNNEYQQAIEKIEASQRYLSSYSTYVELGRYYEKSGDMENALKNWEIALHMIPNRFEPLYLQIDTYHRNGRYLQADSLSALFLQKERKIDAIRIDLMMRDVKRWAKEREMQPNRHDASSDTLDE